MGQFLNKYRALIRRSIGVILEYRVAMLIWTFSASLPLVMLSVWLSLAEEGPVGGYSAGDFVGYFLLVFYMRQMTAVWVAWELDFDIRHGDLNTKLLHPIHPIHEYIAFNLGDKLMRGIIFTPIVILAALLVPGVPIVFTPVTVGLFALGLAGAWLMRYLIQFSLATMSFWISQTLVLVDVFWLFFLVFGGGVAPLELLPEPLRAMAYILPFRFMLSFPAEIMLGRVPPVDVAVGFATMAFWIALLFVIQRVMWARGICRFGAFGA